MVLSISIINLLYMYFINNKDEFKQLEKRAIRFGAKKLALSKRKNKKYALTLMNGKVVHFGDSRYVDYLSHKDKGRRDC